MSKGGLVASLVGGAMVLGYGAYTAGWNVANNSEPASSPASQVQPAESSTPAPTATPTPTPAPAPKPASNCNPNYSPCIPNSSYDLDCADVGMSVSVTGTDVYNLDRDGDGRGCESY